MLTCDIIRKWVDPCEAYFLRIIWLYVLICPVDLHYKSVFWIIYMDDYSGFISYFCKRKIYFYLLAIVGLNYFWKFWPIWGVQEYLFGDFKPIFCYFNLAQFNEFEILDTCETYN